MKLKRLVDPERERIREAVTKLTDAIRTAAPHFRESGWDSTTDALLRLARKADKAVK